MKKSLYDQFIPSFILAVSMSFSTAVLADWVKVDSYEAGTYYINGFFVDVDDQTLVLDPTAFVPAPAQGVLGLQVRSADQQTQQVLSQLNHPEVASKIALERGVLQAMDGGCQLPLGVQNL